jgi:CubicO group peptidase (beta-lactamase class C family)
LVMQAGEVVDETLCGYADVESQSRLTERSLFRLASATKYFISLLLLRLVDKGEIAFDDNLADYFPEFASPSIILSDGSTMSAKKPITIEDLARHSHGYSYGDKEPFRSAMIHAGLMKTDPVLGPDWTHEMSLPQWMSRLSEVPMEHDVGETVSYGLGHDILGAVIEKIAGMPLDECFEREISEPLRLNSTFFVVPNTRSEDLTSFYLYDEGLKRLETGLTSQFLQRPRSFSGGGGWDMLGNGGLVTSARDFARVLQLVLDKGAFEAQQFLNPDSVARLNSNRTEAIGEMLPGHGYSYGIGYQKESAASAGRGGVGKLWWGGSTNPYFFVDPGKALLGVYLTHTFPFGHPDAAHTLERMTYKVVG